MGGVVFCRPWRAFACVFVAVVGAGCGHVGVLAPSRFCLRVAGVVAIFVGEGRVLAWVFSPVFVRGFSRIRVWARDCLFGCVVGSVSFSDGWFSCWCSG